jgi:hypothetical protein
MIKTSHESFTRRYQSAYFKEKDIIHFCIFVEVVHPSTQGDRKGVPLNHACECGHAMQ